MQTTFGLAGVSPFSFRRCLWLCLPALVLGAVLRLSLLLAIPEGFYGSDSNSYFETASVWHQKGRFKLPPKRRYLYPLLLVAAPLAPFCNTPQIVAVVQHAAGLAMLVGLGWITGHLVRRPALWVPPVTLFAALWPRMIYYEHELIGECLLLGVFIPAAALAAPLNGLASHRRLGWFLVLALGIMAVKPVGRPLWLGLLLAAMLLTRRPLAWPRLFFLTVPVAVLLSMTTGGDKQGAWLFLSSTLPLVRTEGEPYARERAILRPVVEAARADLPNYAFNESTYKKKLSSKAELGPEYAAFAADQPHFTKVAKRLGREAVLAHPFEFAKLTLLKACVAGSSRDHDNRLVPAIFWRDQEESSAGRWEKRPQEMALLYEMEEPAYRAMVAERAQRKVWFEPLAAAINRVQWVNARPGAPGERPQIGPAPLGWLLLLGLAGALVPGRFSRTAILWLPVAIYLAVVFAVGDCVSRYLHPLEWAMFILIAVGLDVVLDACAVFFKKRKPATPPG